MSSSFSMRQHQALPSLRRLSKQYRTTNRCSPKKSFSAVDRLSSFTRFVTFSLARRFSNQFPFQLRKVFPTLICAIWMDNLSTWRANKRIFKLLTTIRSIYDMIFRNIIAPVIGTSLVFIHKDEFNT